MTINNCEVLTVCYLGFSEDLLGKTREFFEEAGFP